MIKLSTCHNGMEIAYAVITEPPYLIAAFLGNPSDIQSICTEFIRTA
jgi:hypothetical protein